MRPPAASGAAVALFLLLLPSGFPWVKTVTDAQSTAVVVGANVSSAPWYCNDYYAFRLRDAGAQWIWATANANVAARTDVGYIFSQSFRSTHPSDTAWLYAAVDEKCKVVLNGRLAGYLSGAFAHGGGMSSHALSLSIPSGTNVLELWCVNSGGRAGVIATVDYISNYAYYALRTNGSWSVRTVHPCDVWICDSGHTCNRDKGLCEPSTSLPAAFILSSVLDGPPWYYRGWLNAEGSGASWIWGTPRAHYDVGWDAPTDVGYVFTNSFTVDEEPYYPISLNAVVDDECLVILNGQPVGRIASSGIVGNTLQAQRVSLTAAVRLGRNTLELQCVNWGRQAGLYGYVHDGTSFRLRTDGTWATRTINACDVRVCNAGWACARGSGQCVPPPPLPPSPSPPRPPRSPSSPPAPPPSPPPPSGTATLYILSNNVRAAPWRLSNSSTGVNVLISAMAQWIWGSSGALSSAPANVGYAFSRSYTAAAAMSARLVAVVDDECKVVLNGAVAGRIYRGYTSGGSGGPSNLTLTLRAGPNMLELLCANDGGAAGLVAVLQGAASRSSVLLRTDASWAVNAISNPCTARTCNRGQICSSGTGYVCRNPLE